MNAPNRKALSLCALLVLLPAKSLHAQDYLGSWLQAEDFGRQVERSQGEQAQQPTTVRDSSGANQHTPSSPPATTLPPASQARMQLWMQRIKPEYDRRVRIEGKASADRWLAGVARELGMREGRAARARQR